MSLLIKALQKAEQSKTAVAESAAVSSDEGGKPELELAPQPAESTLSLHEESGFDDTPSAATRTQRQAAAVFRAGEGESRGAGASRAMWLAGGGVFFMLLLGAGFYYYLNSLEQPAQVVARPVALPTPRPVPPVVEATVPGAAAEPEQEGVAPAPEADRMKGAVSKPEEVIASVDAKPKEAAVQEVPVKVTRNRAPVASVSDGVMAGYQAFMVGDDALAGRYYRQVALAEPRNVDAWLGLAAVATRLGKTDEATADYMRVLELEPRNAAAQTGMIGLMGQSDPVASESRLKSLLAQQPEAAFLHAALGNLYADQGQWPSAQQAYFQAYHFDVANLEYAFNLAVSLDQMGKAELALSHYQKALELLARGGSAGVDKAQIEARIAQLRQSLNK